MSEFRLAATAAFGLESVVAHELKHLGLEKSGTDNGRISFSGTERDVARANIWLRCADRVLVEMGRFPASDFEELFQGVLKVPWGDILPRDAAVHVTGRSVRSKLSSVPACQSVVKKAIIEALKRTYHGGSFPETGPRFGVEVSLNRDVATIDLTPRAPVSTGGDTGARRERPPSRKRLPRAWCTLADGSRHCPCRSLLRFRLHSHRGGDDGQEHCPRNGTAIRGRAMAVHAFAGLG